MSHIVEVGTVLDSPAWRVESHQFPSKVGGKPAWLDLKHIPPPEALACDKCRLPLVFLCQVYAPFDGNQENFHRTIYIFVCRDPKCNLNIKALRCSLPRENEFYPAEPPAERPHPEFSVTKWTSLCKVCGCRGQKKCGKCLKATYCGREHQVIDWKEGHKKECDPEAAEKKLKRMSGVLFREFEMMMDEEAEEPEVDEFPKAGRCWNWGSLQDADNSDLEQYAAGDHDKAFTKFKERVARDPDQVVRYQRGGPPLWIAAGPKPDVIPNCEYCSGPRRYEFQLMPQLLSVLHENDLDMGVVVIYTCTSSCTDGEKYKSEFVFKQDVDNSCKS